jgi:hypothetical protein
MEIKLSPTSNKDDFEEFLENSKKYEKHLIIIDTSGSMDGSINVLKDEANAYLDYLKLDQEKSNGKKTYKFNIVTEDDGGSSAISKHSEILGPWEHGEPVDLNKENITQAKAWVNKQFAHGGHSLITETLSTLKEQYDIVLVISDSYLHDPVELIASLNRGKKVPVFSVIPSFFSESKARLSELGDFEGLGEDELQLVQLQLALTIAHLSSTEKQELSEERQSFLNSNGLDVEFDPYLEALHIAKSFTAEEINKKILSMEKKIANKKSILNAPRLLGAVEPMTLEKVSTLTGGNFLYVPAAFPFFVNYNNILRSKHEVTSAELDKSRAELNKKLNELHSIMKRRKGE